MTSTQNLKLTRQTIAAKLRADGFTAAKTTRSSGVRGWRDLSAGFEVTDPQDGVAVVTWQTSTGRVPTHERASHVHTLGYLAKPLDLAGYAVTVDADNLRILVSLAPREEGATR